METEFDRLVDAFPGQVWSARGDGQAVFFNLRWREFTGLSADAAMGLGWLSAIHPDDHAQVGEQWASMLASGRSGGIEARLRRHDGAYRWFRCEISPVRDAAGGIVQWCGINTDIEDRRASEAALQVSEQRLRQIINTLPTTAWQTDPEGNVEFLSDRWLDYAGITAEEGLGLGWGRVIHPDDAPGLFAYWQSALVTGTGVDTEARMRRHDGEYRWFLFRASPMRDENGSIVKWFGTNIDIEDRKRADEALLASERNLRQIINTLPTTAWQTDAQGFVEFLSDRWLDYAGFTAEQGAGLGWGAAIHPDDAQGLFAYWQSCLETGTPVDTEARMRRFDGEHRWFLFRANPLRDADGAITKWYGANIDIEDRKRADEALLASEHNLKLTINTIPTAAWSAQADGTADFLSDTYLAYAGVTSEQMEGWGWRAIIHPDDLDDLEAHWRGSLETGTPVDTEARMRRSDGVFRWFLFRANPLRDARGAIVRWYGHNTDIEDRKHAESLLAGEKHLLAMVAQGRPIEEVLQALCRIVERNAPGALCSILSIDPDGKRFRHGAGPSLPQAYNAVLDGLIIDRDYGPCGLAALTKAQAIAADVAHDRRWQASPWPSIVTGHGLKACWSTPILSADDRVIGVFALYQREPASPTPVEEDLIRQFAHVASIAIERSQSDTELRRTDEALRRANAHLEEAQRISKSGSFTWDVVAGEQTFSEEIRRTFGFGPEVRLTLAMILAAVHRGDSAEVARALRGARDGRGFDLAFRVLRGDGEVRHVRMLGHRIEHIVDRPVFLGALQDITESKVAEEALTQARSELAHVARVATLNAMTASIVHEVSQPLAGILTNAYAGARMLGAEPPNVEGAAGTIRRTIRDTDRASEVIKRLRAMYSAKAPAMGPLDVNDVVREVIALSAGEMRRSRAVVEAQFMPGLPPVNADRIQLQQVVLNLLLNAADAMAAVESRPRSILATTGLDAAVGVTVSVRDAGMGVDPKDLEKLFQPFYSTKAEGMGVGLSICRSIIESHGGRLWAMPNEGPGVTFAFSIPGCADV